MIGTYLFWDRAAPGQTRAQAFAGALRSGAASSQVQAFDGAILCNGSGAANSPLPHLKDGRGLLFDGFIANRRTMRVELGGDRDLSAADDATLYAAARDRWGEAADHHLIGEYAAIMVPVAQGPVEVVRSPIAAPAIYIWHDSERLIVTTAVQAIFSTGEIKRILDDQKLADSLLLNYGEERRAWFQGVTRLPRGTRAIADRSGVREQVFYSITDITPVIYTRDSDYVEAAEALFNTAIADMLDGFSRPAISLSGGLDSQAVAAFAMRLFPDRPLLSGTSVPQAGWVSADPSRLADESPHVRALAEMYPQLKPQWIVSKGRDISHFQRDLFETAMVPPRNAANLHWIHDLRRAMQEAGADVVLSGGMGNLTFSFDGTGAIPDMLRRGQIGSWLREIWHGGPLYKLGHRAFREGVAPFLPYQARLALHHWRSGAGHPPLDSWSPLNPEYARHSNVVSRASEMGMDINFVPITSVAEFRQVLLNGAANEGGDIGTGIDRLHGLPGLDPTRHRSFLEFCFAIPASQYVNRGRRRWLARRMMAGKVPAMVLRETRRGRQAADWFSRMTPARTQLIDEIDWLMTDPDVAGRLDLTRLRQALVDLPADEASLGSRHAITLQLALSRGLTTARFIRFINGRNDI